MSHAEDYADLGSHDVRVARVLHKCTACSEVIRPGDTYHRYGSLYDGSWSTTKQCVRCRAIFEAVCDATPGEPVLLNLDCGDPWEDVIGPCPPEVAALAFALPWETVEN